MLLKRMFASGALLLAAAGLSACEFGAGAEYRDKPVMTDLNAITIVVDDMDDFSCSETEQYLPRSSRWLLNGGTCFENATTATPVCCPARAQIQTGQLPHNNGVERQIDAAKLDYRHTLQYQLTRARVATYGIGKYLNGLDASRNDNGYVTGFDDTDFWQSYHTKDYQLYRESGKQFLPQHPIHTTVRTGRYLRAFVKKMSKTARPFYAYAAFLAPHAQNIHGAQNTSADFPEPTRKNAEKTAPPFDYSPETNLKDKLPHFNKLQLDEAYFRAFHAARVRALFDIDDQIARTFELLESEGMLDNTAVFFMSDNGYSLGENGWDGKAVPYAAAVNIPMLAYLPGRFAAGEIDRREVSLIDFAPTLYDLYDLRPTYQVDGHSLLDTDIARVGQFFEFHNEKGKLVRSESGLGSSRLPSWKMYRQGNRSYIEYYKRDGSILAREFYIGRAQTRNLLHPMHADRAPSHATVQRFHELIESYQECAGTQEAGARHPCP